MTQTPNFNKQLLIFDLDGTLVDSFLDIALSVNEMLSEMQLPVLEVDLIKTYIGAGARQLVMRSLQTAGVDPEQHIEHARSLFVGIYGRNLTKNTRFFEGAESFLDDALQQGLTVALCTNKPLEFTTVLLDALRTRERFALILGGDSLPVKKPDPAPLQFIMERLGFEAEDTLMFGDSIYDVMAAKNAGIECWAVTTGHHSEEELWEKGADKVFGHISEISLG